MYNDLQSMIRSHGLWLETTIDKLPKSHCDDTGIVLDFHTIKTKIAQLTGNNTCASVSGLVFNSENKLYFIQTENYWARFAEGSMEDMMEGLASGEVKNKLIGTVQSLSHLTEHSENLSFEAFHKKKKRDTIETLILMDLPARQSLILHLATFDKKLISGPHEVVGEIHITNCSDIKDFI
jgi:hypothetical protein